MGVNEIAKAADLSWRELRRALRTLPSERRRAVLHAVREGRAVNDRRDAALAVAWARRIQAVPWVGWALPKTRPHGRRAILWIAHGIWVLFALVLAIIFTWRSLGAVRWIFVGVFVYGIVSVPWVLRVGLETRWNAPEAERRNRELLARTPER